MPIAPRDDTRNEDQLQPSTGRTLDSTKTRETDTQSRDGSHQGTNDIGGYVPTR